MVTLCARGMYATISSKHVKQQAVEAEAARAERASALEPVPAPDHLRYGGMTQAPLVRQLFAGLAGAGARGTAAAASLTGATGPHARGAAGNRILTGGVGRGAAGSKAVEGKVGGGGATKGVGPLRPGGGVQGGRGIGGGGGSGKQRVVGGAPAGDERRPPLGGGGDHGYTDGFASTLEHHRRNVIAITVPPVQAVGAGGVAPETLTRGGGRGGRSEGSGRGSKPENA